MKQGTYKNLNGKTVDFNYTNKLSLSQRTSFAMEVAGMVVSDALGYSYILEEPIFNYCLIKYFTNINIFEEDSDFNLDALEKFLKDNEETVIKPLLEYIGDGQEYSDLYKACDMAIEFRKTKLANGSEGVSELLQAVRELIVKPDYLNELLIALTNAVNSFADNSANNNIDMATVNKLADVVSVMKEMGGADVAKAIITMQNEENKTAPKADKPKSTRGKKLKANTENKVISISEASKDTVTDKDTTKEGKQ